MKKNKMEKRRILLFLPLLLVPTLALVFMLLGGGKADKNEPSNSARGINASLPDAQLGKERNLDKMEIYEQNPDSVDTGGLDVLSAKLGFGEGVDPQTAKINEKLAAINAAVNVPEVTPKTSLRANGNPSGRESISKDVEKLELLMKGMKSGNGEDPELTQLSSILQSIQEIQNPALAKQKYQPLNTGGIDSLFRAIPAVIASNQRAVEGSVVELRLLDSIIINGQLVPKGHSVFGTAAFSNQRLDLQIKNIRLGTSVIPVSLTVFDKRDAMVGIYAPEALLHDAIGKGSTDALSTIDISGFDLPTQLASAGLDAAKSVMSRKIKRVKQKLKAGYPVLLRDNSKRFK
jgi:hypothetical protein